MLSISQETSCSSRGSTAPAERSSPTLNASEGVAWQLQTAQLAEMTTTAVNIAGDVLLI